MWRKILIAGLFCVVSIGLFPSTTLSAQAAVTKSVSINCLSPQPGWVWDTVYLFPQENLTITFEDCDWDLYVDTDPDPSLNNLTPSRGDGDGVITFSADGTYVISSNMTHGTPQGQWITDGHSANYIYLEPHGAINPMAYIEIDVAKNNVTTVSGKTLLASPMIQFPTTVDSRNLMSTDQNLAQCIQYVPNSLSDTYVIVQTPLTTNVSGEVTIRTISTNPVTSFTNFLLLPDGYRGMTPLLNVNHLVYTNFDPEHPAEGLVGCGQERNEGGDYLLSGEVLSNRYFETTVNLAAGNYTIVSAVEFPMSPADWNNNVGWTPLEGQSVNVQIWGPAQLSTAATPVLASTGAHSWLGNAALVILTLGFTLVLLKRRRSQKA